MPEAATARNDFTTLLDKVNEAENAGDFETALALCIEGLARAPQHIKLRCHIGGLLTEQGRIAEAEKLLREGLARQPESVSLARNLAKALGEQSRFDEAAGLARDLIWPLRKDTAFRVAYASWLVRMGENASRAVLDRLAGLWSELNAFEKAIEDEWLIELEAGRKQNAAPIPPNPAYVRALFDCYAEGFDEHLASLGYCAPAVLRTAVDRALRGRAGLDVIDLGCGTGLAGEALKPLARHLTGIDCAPRMLICARRRGIYDQLIEGDMVAVLKTLPQADLVAAADVLIYLGDLKELFIQIARVLRPGGCFAATIEQPAVEANMEDTGYVLQETRRYAHSEAYIRRLAAASLLEILSMEPFIMRREGKTGIGAVAFVAGKKK